MLDSITPFQKKPLGRISELSPQEPLFMKSTPSSFSTLAFALFQLTKPRLASLVLFTMSAGIFLAPASSSLSPLVATLAVLATFGIIGASNSFNMYFDRHMDLLMDRTKNRPLPSGRLSPQIALLFAFFLLGLTLPLLYLCSNLLTTLLGASAAFLYVAVYTPLKPKTPLAVYIGSIPGALPILMGYTTVTNRIDGLGLSLFAILVLWQLPHFLSISLHLLDDYQKAQVQVYSVALGIPKTRKHLVFFSVLLGMTTLTPLFFSSASWLYGSVATVLALYFMKASFFCLKAPHPETDRKYFLATLVHLPLLLTVLIVDLHSIHLPF